MILLILSFFAGILTVFAPCILPLLPLIIGGSITGDEKQKYRPYIIIGSLVVSLIGFTLLLKASTLLIGADQNALKYIMQRRITEIAGDPYDRIADLSRIILFLLSKVNLTIKEHTLLS